LTDKKLLSKDLLKDAPTEPAAAKPRKYSHSTADSTTLADDVSCGSMSVVSFASAPTAVTLGSTSEQSGKSLKSEETLEKARPCGKQKKQKAKKPRQQNRGGGDRKISSSRSGKRDNRESDPPPKSGPARLRREEPPKKSLRTIAKSPKKDNTLPQKATSVNRQVAPSPATPPSPVDSFFSSPSHQFAHTNNIATQSRLPTANNSPPSLAPGTKPPVTTLRYGYGVPDYAQSISFSNGDGRYTPGKMELAGFLAKVGLMGSACADLLASVADVDALELLSSAQFRDYNVSAEKQTQIAFMLQVRRQSRAERMDLLNGEIRQAEAAASLPRYGYGVPDYARMVSFAHGDGRHTPGKMELAGFLAQVGLMGPDCADLLRNANSVDSLERLTDAQYRLYGVSADKQAEILWMLEVRRRSRENPRPWNRTPIGVVRPPPGLSDYRCANPFSVPSPPPFAAMNQEPSQNLFVPPATSPLFAHHQTMNAAEAEEESRIEAELQELGGQMVGSVLDF